MNTSDIEAHWVSALRQANAALSGLPVAEGRTPNVSGLNGWIFEQTMRWCIQRELSAAGLALTLKDQAMLFGRVRVDLVVGKVALELKAAGFFGSGDAAKYVKYRLAAEKRGWVYVYVTWHESVARYRKLALNAFGDDRTFFLEDPGAWERLIRALIEINR